MTETNRRTELAEKSIHEVFARLEGEDWVRANDRYTAALQVLAGELNAAYPPVKTSPSGHAIVSQPEEDSVEWVAQVRRPAERQLRDVRWEGIFQTRGGWQLLEQKAVAPFRVISPEGKVNEFGEFQEALDYALSQDREGRKEQ